MENNIIENNNNDDNMNKIRWKNRRIMAWVSLISMIMITIMLIYSPIPIKRLEILATPITWFYFSMTSIIGAYMGFTTWASFKK